MFIGHYHVLCEEQGEEECDKALILKSLQLCGRYILSQGMSCGELEQQKL